MKIVKLRISGMVCTKCGTELTEVRVNALPPFNCPVCTVPLIDDEGCPMNFQFTVKETE